MTTLKWAAPEPIATYLSAELNSLVDGGNKLGAAIANGTDLYRFINLELTLAAQAAARNSDARVEVYLLPSVDGANYAYGSDTQDPASSTWVGSFELTEDVTARIVTLDNIAIPALDSKLLLINRTGQSFAGTGNTLKYRRHNEQAV